METVPLKWFIGLEMVIFLVLASSSSFAFSDIEIISKFSKSQLEQYFDLEERNKEYYLNNVKVTQKRLFFKGLNGIKINDTYFEGITEINVKYGLFCGHYNPTLPKKGMILINPSHHLCGYIDTQKQLFIHELKHHWCWVNKRYVDVWHRNCFKNVSII